MNPALWGLGRIHLLDFAVAAEPMARAPGATHGRPCSGRCRARKARYALQRMQRELMPRQDFTGRFTQANGRDRKNKQREIESNSENKNYRTRYQAYRRPGNELIEISRGRWMQIDLQIPTQRKQRKQPNVVSPQPSPNRFPNGDREMRRQQIGVEMRSPCVIAR